MEPFNFSFFSISGWGIGLDFCVIVRFAMEMNRDHSVIPKMDGHGWRVLIKCGPLEKGMANHFSSCLENPMNSMKRQKDRTFKDELLRSVGVEYTTGDQWRNNSRRMKRWRQSKHTTQLWM